jgi:2-polyprenyl-3-methyl-5-hydroxy-6-metoxy-1,4-benzoquinol methylase
MTASDWNLAYEGETPETPVDRHIMEVAGDLQPGTAIDLGCGTGQNSIWLAQQGWIVTGLDIAADAIAGAREAAATAGVEVDFSVADLREWQPDTTYDLVVSTYALPARGPGRRQALQAAAAAVAPGGTFLCSEFDQSLADEGWMHAEDLVTIGEVTGYLAGFTVMRADVENTEHAHGTTVQQLPVVLVVAARQG